MLLDVTFTSMISDALTVISTVFTWITSNWLLMGTLGVSIVLGVVFAVYSRFHR